MGKPSKSDKELDSLRDNKQNSKNYARNVNEATNLQNRANNMDPFGMKKNMGKLSNIPGYGMVGNTLASMAGSAMLNRQANLLKQGGVPVYGNTTSGKQMVMGVMHKNVLGHQVYTGRSDFNPIGSGRRSQEFFNQGSGSYNVGTGFRNVGKQKDTYVTSSGGGGGSEPVGNYEPSNTSGSKVALKASSASGVRTRYFMQ